jgi:hypothetical protein
METNNKSCKQNINNAVHITVIIIIIILVDRTTETDRLCGLVVRVLDYRCRGLGFDSWALKKSSGYGTGSAQPREYN